MKCFGPGAIVGSWNIFCKKVQVVSVSMGVRYNRSYHSFLRETVRFTQRLCLGIDPEFSRYLRKEAISDARKQWLKVGCRPAWFVKWQWGRTALPPLAQRL